MNDKLLHFIIAIVITLVILIASHLWFPLNYNWDMALACGVAILLTIGKELIWDKILGKGTPEFYDFFWGVVGAIIGPMLWMIGELILGVAKPLP